MKHNILDTLDLYYSDFYKKKKNKVFLVLSLVVSVLFAILQSIGIPTLLSNIREGSSMLALYRLCILFIFLNIIFYFKGYFEINLSNNMNKSSRIKFFNAIINKYSESFRDIDIGNYVTRIMNATSELSRFTTLALRTILPLILIMVIISGYMFFINRWLSFIFFLNLICIFILIFTLGNITRVKKQTAEFYYYNLYSNLNNKYSNLLNTYLNNETNNEKKDINVLQENHKKLELEHGFYRILLNASLFFCVSIFSVISLYIYIKNNLNKTNEGTLIIILIILFITSCFSFIDNISPLISNIAISEGSFEFLFDLVENKRKNLKKNIKDGSVLIMNLDFKYNDTKILRNVNLKIKSGDKIGIIGRSGSGKTTLLKLILKLYPYDGMIKVGNTDIQKLDTKYLREKIIYINQRTDLLDKTILENIKYGNNLSNKDIVYFLKKYKLLDVFSKLKNGLHENVIINGSNLSGGMKRIIILCRGILKSSNSLIVMIDEPLSGLDPITRKKIIKMIKYECRNKTLIIISHNQDIKFIVDKLISINSIQK